MTEKNKNKNDSQDDSQDTRKKRKGEKRQTQKTLFLAKKKVLLLGDFVGEVTGDWLGALEQMPQSLLQTSWNWK